MNIKRVFDDVPSAVKAKIGIREDIRSEAKEE